MSICIDNTQTLQYTCVFSEELCVARDTLRLGVCSCLKKIGNKICESLMHQIPICDFCLKVFSLLVCTQRGVHFNVVLEEININVISKQRRKKITE